MRELAARDMPAAGAVGPAPGPAQKEMPVGNWTACWQAVLGALALEGSEPGPG